MNIIHADGHMAVHGNVKLHHSSPVGASALPSAASYIQQYHLMELNPQKMKIFTFLSWQWSRKTMPLSERERQK